jgi:hypothetical protein
MDVEKLNESLSDSIPDVPIFQTLGARGKTLSISMNLASDESFENVFQRSKQLNTQKDVV